MSKPCGHDPARPDMCRVCWLYENRPDYRDVYDRPEAEFYQLRAAATDAPPCRGCTGRDEK